MPAMAETDKWVTPDRLIRRTCPSVHCGNVGSLFFREKATVYEQKDGWSRITKSYDASCVNGLSEYVDNGNAACVKENGIVDGQFSEWVSTKFLSETRPADPSANAAGDYALIKGSDDFRIYKDVFVQAALKLISSGQCTAADFQEMGGWVKSANHIDSPIYFAYCGGMTQANRIYLNAATADTFK